ncbi:MAG: chromosome segregation protein SMC [Bacteroidota bacterium]
MKLVSLEIKGFKSFADKTTIHFNENMTGVVGPNGCGKSNVVDAIRWVLGEQKTSVLRSEKMENVIFNGTRNRKPSALAEVFLTFENDKNLLPSEYNTVTISRHYYRSGESEYRLNNVNCRLKDITNLFLDTGISSDSYAIIELGMVNEILNDKDNSRRKLFEQAAGISKYKSRKKETLNKLEATQADLNRVDDLLFEIDNNLKSLESQARKTERYHKLKEEYKELSIQLALHHLKDYKVIFDNIQTQQTEQQDKKIVLETELLQYEAKLQADKNDFLEKEKNLLQAQRKLNELVSYLKQKENDKNLVTENIRHLNEKVENWKRQNDQASIAIQSLEQSIASFTERKTTEETTLIQLQTDLEQAKSKLELIRLQHTDARRTLESENQQMRSIENEIVDLEKKITVLKVQKDNLIRETDVNERDLQQRNEERSRLAEQLVDLEQKENSERDAIHHLTQLADSSQQQITNLETKINDVREELNARHRSLDARQNEFNLTKSFIENMEGFPDSIKFLKNNSDWNKQAPLLSDVISAQSEYRVAIESFLEPYLNYYVVNDMQEAMQAVNLLSNAAKGRANFFVLNDFENETAETAPAESAIRALDVVECEDRYRNLVNYLLRNVFIVDEQQQLPNLKATFIARSGKYIRNRYAVSGGQVGAAGGKRLGRVKNLENLSKEINQLKAESDQLRQRLQEFQQELASLKSNNHDKQLDALRDTYNLTRNQITGIKTKLENIDRFYVDFDVKKNSITERGTAIDADLLIMNDVISQKQQIRENQQAKIQEANQQFNHIDTQLSEASQLFNQNNILFLQQQNKINAFTQEINFKRLQLDETNHNIDRNKTELESASRQLLELESRKNETEAELILLYEDKTRQDNLVADVDRIFYESRGAINELEEQIRNIAKQKEHCDLLLNEMRDKVNDLKLQLASLKERLDLEFKISIDDLMEQEPGAELNKEDLNEKVGRMKNRLENFGEINPFAVEAFNEMKQRADFIVTQKNDLVTAKESLMNTIDEIESKAREQFMEAFNQVKENFVNVFRNLFTAEDTCDLILSNPDSPLESSIDIIAKPKGKRPQTINQLSGGEKTLTAISLLFALYLLKPAPFCVLDEVDAPLDDANVGKFTDIIRQFSDKSQFILVTHNKQTMASVDVIYGVTMQEEGVSKVVPVDFRQLQEAEAV